MLFDIIFSFTVMCVCLLMRLHENKEAVVFDIVFRRIVIQCECRCRRAD